MAKATELRQVQYPPEFLERVCRLLPRAKKLLAITPEHQYGRVVGNELRNALRDRSPEEFLDELIGTDRSTREIGRLALMAQNDLAKARGLLNENQAIRRSFGYA